MIGTYTETIRPSACSPAWTNPMNAQHPRTSQTHGVPGAGVEPRPEPRPEKTASNTAGTRPPPRIGRRRDRDKRTRSRSGQTDLPEVTNIGDDGVLEAASRGSGTAWSSIPRRWWRQEGDSAQSSRRSQRTESFSPQQAGLGVLWTFEFLVFGIPDGRGPQVEQNAGQRGA